MAAAKVVTARVARAARGGCRASLGRPETAAVKPAPVPAIGPTAPARRPAVAPEAPAPAEARDTARAVRDVRVEAVARPAAPRPAMVMAGATVVAEPATALVVAVEGAAVARTAAGETEKGT